MTLIEIMVASTILVLTSGAVISSLTAARGLSEVTDERTVAREAIDATLERIKAAPFRDVYALHNADDADDPDGVGTAPGPSFDAGPLRPQIGDPDGRVGEVIFPSVGGELREDVVDPFLGLPRDLDIDGTVDAADHSFDYRILPLTVRVAWRGAHGDQELVQRFVLGDLR